jgi:hypothetical protein
VRPAILRPCAAFSEFYEDPDRIPVIGRTKAIKLPAIIPLHIKGECLGKRIALQI